MDFDDRPDYAKRLEQARLARGFKTAVAACEYFGWTYSSYAQHEQGKRGISRIAGTYAAAYRVSEGWLLTGEGHGPANKMSKAQVPLKRYVGAGAEIYPFDQDDSEYIDAPPGLSGDAVAAMIRGDSMMPRYDDGDVIVWSKQLPPEELLNREAVVCLSDGRVMVKTVTRGSQQGLWTLISFNGGPIVDQPVEWAAPIEWVKR